MFDELAFVRVALEDLLEFVTRLGQVVALKQVLEILRHAQHFLNLLFLACGQARLLDDICDFFDSNFFLLRLLLDHFLLGLYSKLIHFLLQLFLFVDLLRETFHFLIDLLHIFFQVGLNLFGFFECFL